MNVLGRHDEALTIVPSDLLLNRLVRNVRKVEQDRTFSCGEARSMTDSHAKIKSHPLEASF